ncbi:MAG: hypothetical protein ACI8PD_000868, partial [Nitrospinales bacterium]
KSLWPSERKRRHHNFSFPYLIAAQAELRASEK